MISLNLIHRLLNQTQAQVLYTFNDGSAPTPVEEKDLTFNSEANAWILSLAGLRENELRAALDLCPYAVRVRDEYGRENLHASVVATIALTNEMGRHLGVSSSTSNNVPRETTD